MSSGLQSIVRLISTKEAQRFNWCYKELKFDFSSISSNFFKPLGPRGSGFKSLEPLEKSLRTIHKGYKAKKYAQNDNLSRSITQTFDHALIPHHTIHRPGNRCRIRSCVPKIRYRTICNWCVISSRPSLHYKFPRDLSSLLPSSIWLTRAEMYLRTPYIVWFSQDGHWRRLIIILWNVRYCTMIKIRPTLQASSFKSWTRIQGGGGGTGNIDVTFFIFSSNSPESGYTTTDAGTTLFNHALFFVCDIVTSLAFSNSEDLKNGDLRIGRSRNLRLYAVRCSIPNWHLCYLCMDNLSAGGTIRYEMDSESDLHLLGFIPWQQAGQKSVKLTSLTKNAVVDKLLSQVLFWWGKLRLATRWQCSMTCNLWCKHLPEPW